MQTKQQPLEKKYIVLIVVMSLILAIVFATCVTIYSVNARQIHNSNMVQYNLAKQREQDQEIYKQLSQDFVDENEEFQEDDEKQESYTPMVEQYDVKKQVKTLRGVINDISKQTKKLPTASNLQELQNDVKQVSNKADQIQQSINGLPDIGGLENKVDQIQQSINGLNIPGEINLGGLEDSVQQIINNQGDIQTDIANMNASLTTNGDLHTKITQIKNTLSNGGTVYSKVSDMKSTLDNMDLSDLSTIKNKLSSGGDIYTGLGDLQTGLGELQTDLTSVKNKLSSGGDIYTDIVNMNTQITGQNGALQQIKDVLTENSSGTIPYSISQLQNQVESINIPDVSQDIQDLTTAVSRLSIPTVSDIQNGLATTADLSGLATQSDIQNLSIPTVQQIQNGLAKTADLSALATTSDLQNLSIPTVADIQNGLAKANDIPTVSDIQNGLATTADLSGLATQSDIPTVAQIQNGLAKTSDLSGLATTSDIQNLSIPTVADIQNGLAKTTDLPNDYLTANDITGLATTSDIPTVAQIQNGLATSQQITNLQNQIPTVAQIQNGLAKANDIPTVSDIQNGLATTADLSGLATQSDIQNLSIPTVQQIQNGLATSGDISGVSTKIGTLGSGQTSVLADLNTINTTVGGINTNLGTPSSGTVAGKVDTIEARSDYLIQRLGYPASGTTVAGNVATINTKIGQDKSSANATDDTGLYAKLNTIDQKLTNFTTSWNSLIELSRSSNTISSIYVSDSSAHQSHLQDRQYYTFQRCIFNTDLNDMFNGCSNLQAVTFYKCIFYQVQHAERMFEGCTALEFVKFDKKCRLDRCSGQTILTNSITQLITPSINVSNLAINNRLNFVGKQYDLLITNYSESDGIISMQLEYVKVQYTIQDSREQSYTIYTQGEITDLIIDGDTLDENEVYHNGIIMYFYDGQRLQVQKNFMFTDSDGDTIMMQLYHNQVTGRIIGSTSSLKTSQTYTYDGNDYYYGENNSLHPKETQTQLSISDFLVYFSNLTVYNKTIYVRNVKLTSGTFSTTDNCLSNLPSNVDRVIFQNFSFNVALQYMFYKSNSITSSVYLTVEFNFSYIDNLSYGLASLFANYSSTLYDITARFPNLTTASGSNVMRSMFWNESGRSRVYVNFPKLTTINGQQCMRTMFGCHSSNTIQKNVTAYFPELTAIVGTYSATYRMCYAGSGTNNYYLALEMPKLTIIQQTSTSTSSSYQICYQMFHNAGQTYKIYSLNLRQLQNIKAAANATSYYGYQMFNNTGEFNIYLNSNCYDIDSNGQIILKMTYRNTTNVDVQTGLYLIKSEDDKLQVRYGTT